MFSDVNCKSSTHLLRGEIVTSRRKSKDRLELQKENEVLTRGLCALKAKLADSEAHRDYCFTVLNISE